MKTPDIRWPHPLRFALALTLGLLVRRGRLGAQSAEEDIDPLKFGEPGSPAVSAAKACSTHDRTTVSASLF